MSNSHHEPDVDDTRNGLADSPQDLTPDAEPAPALGDAIIESTLTGRVVAWNDAAERLLGYRVSEVLGRNLALFSPLNRAEEIDPLLTPIRRGNTIVKMDTERVHKNGTRIHVAIHIAPVTTYDGKIIGARTSAHALCN
jgi:PAS domain S-box-containing protein